MLEMKKGDKVIVKGFTGIKLGVFPVESTTKKTITVLKKNGDEMIFDRKTGKQVNVEEGKEKYANSIMEDDGSYVAPSTKGAAKKKAAKKAETKSKVEEDYDEDEDIDDEDDEDEDEDEPAPKKPVKKSSKPIKKSKKVVEDDDDDDFEEVDD